MKKVFFAAFVAVCTIVVSSCGKQTYSSVDAVPVNYLVAADVVNSAAILPPPPDTTSALWHYDVERYVWGKSMRATPRGQQAIEDAALHGDGLAHAFSEAFGMEISFEETPAIYALIKHMREDAGNLSTKLAKEYYSRPRPFVVFGEPSGIPDDEDALRDNGSYPSGHSAIGFATALVLAEINPDRADEIMRRGFEIGESRVIVGYHFDSDVRMGRLCAAMVVPILHTDPQFICDLDAAKREFISKSGKINKR